jgi:hypothetical protein
MPSIKEISLSVSQLLQTLQRFRDSGVKAPTDKEVRDRRKPSNGTHGCFEAYAKYSSEHLSLQPRVYNIEASDQEWWEARQ